jgi:cell division protein FtsB
MPPGAHDPLITTPTKRACGTDGTGPPSFSLFPLFILPSFPLSFLCFYHFFHLSFASAFDFPEYLVHSSIMDDQYYRKAKVGAGFAGLVSRLLRNRFLGIALLLGIPVLGYILFGSHGVVQRVRLEQQRSELQAKIKDAEVEARKLKQESTALEGDRKTIEKVAREKHLMVRPGEKVYRVAGDK